MGSEETAVSAPLIAPRSPAQFSDVTTALELHLDPDERTELSEPLPR